MRRRNCTKEEKEKTKRGKNGDVIKMGEEKIHGGKERKKVGRCRGKENMKR